MGETMNKIAACSEHLISIDTETLKPHPQNARKHPAKQLKYLAKSIEQFGFRIPIVVDGSDRIVCGHARVEAAKRIGMEHVPAIRASDLTEAEVRAFMIADNRLAELARWDEPLLAESLKFLDEEDLNFDLESVGFDYGEIEQRIAQLELVSDVTNDSTDDVPDLGLVEPVCREDDLWILGHHRLLCSDATRDDSYERLFGNKVAAMVFSDPPYNVSARNIGRVCEGRHGDFAMAAGELDPKEFAKFLGSVMESLCRFSGPGSIHYLFMDWRHAAEMLSAGLAHYSAFKNLCVWVKDRPGMGTFYRSQHELVFVFKNGDVPHQNNFQLGQFGRSRSNVWCYPSARGMNADDGDPDGSNVLDLHPTVKPVKLIEEAILDCSRRNEIILDPFLGSGSTLIAGEKTKRMCYGIELIPRYVDVAINRWQDWTGQEAIHEQTGDTYTQTAQHRVKERIHG